jgi:hypothetical protein
MAISQIDSTGISSVSNTVISGTITSNQLSIGAPTWDATGNVTANTVISNSGIYLNKLTITSNTTIPAGYSATSAGPMTLAANVTISSGSRWVIL